ncbi:hypothetical protein NDU88_007807 [Pleurodeles waltl]|uniref:Uncharacterized protein n=1 Tax=Pleurodeles waltl TaxID=8319 RepID=A0AAV7STV2_PLEWA|nr:hypothetical protein NDU88_007807 [Pleurodeles waltl]
MENRPLPRPVHSHTSIHLCYRAPRRTHQTRQGPQRSDSARKQRQGRSKALPLYGRRLSILHRRALHKRTGEDLYRVWESVRSKDKQRQDRNPTPRPLDYHQRPTATPHQAGLPEDPWSLVRQRRRGGEIMGRKTGEDEAEAGILEPPKADDRKEVFCSAERDPTSAPVRRTSVASAASNSHGHHKNDLLLHLELQDRVKREVMFKTHDKGGKGVPDIATILRETFVCHCVRNTLRSEDESHVGFLMARGDALDGQSSGLR